MLYVITHVEEDTSHLRYGRYCLYLQIKLSIFLLFVQKNA